MSGNDDDTVELVEDHDLIFDDPVSQRAYAFVHLARFAEGAKDDVARDLTYTMMRKVCASIKTNSTADLKVIDGGKS
jgi:hypothetical protein